MTKRNLILISIVLLWGTLVGCASVGAPVAIDAHADVAILHAHSEPGEAVRCLPGADCAEVDVDDVDCQGTTADVVVIAGESSPPMYLGHSAPALAEKIACLQPSLVVLDTQYGFSAPLLHALAVQDVDALVVGSTGPLTGGLKYAPGFYAADLDIPTRASLVSQRSASPLESWKVDRTEIEASLAEVDDTQFEWLVARSSGKMTERMSNPGADEAIVVAAGLR